MAGKQCPKCGELTLWQSGNYLKCSKCGYVVHRASNGGMGGKGKSVLLVEDSLGSMDVATIVVPTNNRDLQAQISST